MNNYKEQFIEDNTETWTEIGAEYKAKRESLGISVASLALNVGVGKDKIQRFENGLPILSAKLLQHSIDMYFELVAKDTAYCEIVNGQGAVIDHVEQATAPYRLALAAFIDSIGIQGVQRDTILTLANDIGDTVQAKTIEYLM